MESLLDEKSIGNSKPGVKKTLIMFSLLWIGPLFILGILSYVISGIEAFENRSLNIFLVGYFLCTATGSSIFVPVLKKWNRRPLQSLIVAAVATWLSIFIYDAIYSNVMFGHAEISISARRGILGVAVVAVGIFLVKSFLQPRRDFTFEFRSNFWKYVKFAVVIAVLQGLFIGSIFAVELWDRSPGLISMYMFGSLFYGLLCAMTALLALFALTSIRFLRSQTLLLVFLTFVACVIVGTFYGVGVLPHLRKMKILVIGLFPAFFTASAMVFLLVRQNSDSRYERKFRRLDNSLSRRNSEYLELRQQTNPHFFFNNLNMLLGLIESDPEIALIFGNRLSHVYRRFLKSDDQDFIPLADELAFISEYIEIYRAKFGSAFNLVLEAEPTQHHFILAHALQEIIDNIFKHNIMEEDHPVDISLSIKNENLVVQNSVRFKDVSE